MTIQHGYAAERINGRFCQSLEEAETFCKEMNEGLWL